MCEEGRGAGGFGDPGKTQERGGQRGCRGAVCPEKHFFQEPSPPLTFQRLPGSRREVGGVDAGGFDLQWQQRGDQGVPRK